MAKSLSTKLKDIKKLEDRAKKELEKARLETEKLIAPTRGKLESVFKERIDKFVRENLEEVISMKIEKTSLSKEIDELLFRNVFGKDISDDERDVIKVEEEKSSKKENVKSSNEDDLIEDSEIYLNK